MFVIIFFFVVISYLVYWRFFFVKKLKKKLFNDIVNQKRHFDLRHIWIDFYKNPDSEDGAYFRILFFKGFMVLLRKDQSMSFTESYLLLYSNEKCSMTTENFINYSKIEKSKVEFNVLYLNFSKQVKSILKNYSHSEHIDTVFSIDLGNNRDKIISFLVQNGMVIEPNFSTPKAV